MGFRENMAIAKQNRDNAGTYENLPLGRYNVVLTGAKRMQSKQGNNMVAVDWVVLEGEYQGKKEKQFHRLEGNRADISVKIMCDEFTLMGVEAYEFEDERDLDTTLEFITASHPMVTMIIFQKGTYINKKVETYLGNYEGDLNDLIPMTVTTQFNDTAEEAKPVEIEVGVNFKYTHNGKEYTGKIVSLNHEAGTLDFPFHKDISVNSLIAPVSA